jgi:hypothetical protein
VEHNWAIVRLTERVLRLPVDPFNRVTDHQAAIYWDWNNVSSYSSRATFESFETINTLKNPFYFSTHSSAKRYQFYSYSTLLEGRDQSHIRKNLQPVCSRFFSTPRDISSLCRKLYRIGFQSSNVHVNNPIDFCSFSVEELGDRARLNLFQVVYSAIISERFLDPECG